MRHVIGAALALWTALFGSVVQGVPAALAQTPPDVPAPADAPAPEPLPAGSNLLNPNVSVIGWFQGEAGDASDEVGSSVFEFREAEIAFQANVDPYSRADFFVAVSPEEGVDLEEGYLSLLTLPAGLTAKLGKFRSNFGKFNRTHPPETPFADRPLAAERFLGEEGLAAAGVSLSWLLPLPFYLNLDAEATNTPDREEAPSFEAYRGQDLLYTGRLSTFLDLGEAANVTVGASVANGANGSWADTTMPSVPEPLRATLLGGDITFRWKNPRRAIYRSLTAQVEWMERRAERVGDPDLVGHGLYAWIDWQFARRWHVGGRYDWSSALEDPPGPGDVSASGHLAFVTFTPSEFSLVSLQARRQELESGDDTRFFLKTTFNIGPHGQHPF